MKIILGLAGEMAAGKGTIAKYAGEKYSAKSYRFSTMLRDLLGRLYLAESRENLQKISTILRQNFGEDLFAKAMLEDIKKDSGTVVVVDGVRRLADIKFLKELPEFKFIYIEADMLTRYKRVALRNENSDDLKRTFEDFKKDHKAETELQIRDLKKHADFLMDNNGTYEDLYKQADKILNK